MEYYKLKFVVVLYFICSFQIEDVQSLKCYTCTATEANSDCECDPGEVVGGITNCNKKYCTLRRVEYKSSGVVYSFYRSCEDNPVYVNNIIEDDTYRTYFYACSTELCNGGTGPDTQGNNGGNNVPVGVTKPPFNPDVLHTGGIGTKVEVCKFMVATVVILTATFWNFFQS